jgi:hypothetical protein
MGLTIHYQGGIDHTDLIPKLIGELEDIAGSMSWKSQRVNDDKPDAHFQGIILMPPEPCEPLSFIFDRGGRLRCLADLLLGQIELTETSGYCATKTQFTSVENHIWIIGLLRYLKKHYMIDLKVTDEGEFWETENRASLVAKKQFLQTLIEQIAEDLQSADFQGNPQSLDDIVAHIEEIVREHVQNNTSVRQMLDQRGIKPEALPPEEDIKKLERRVSTDAKKLGKQAGHMPRPGGTV